ncbi:HTD2 family dehydratase [Cupriavidus yeoncheonensis]|nr:MaoC family dehydratase N-terminal domain-containing protein [Cupriavidus yeoncheonensis]
MNIENGRVSRTETCSVAMARRVAAMLDRDPGAYVEGSPLPRGWQFLLLGADTPRSALRRDGFPGLGVPMPDLGLPRLMLGGRSVQYARDIPIGATVRRLSSIRDLVEKNTAAGRMAIVEIRHELIAGYEVAIVETQTYLLLSAQSNPGAAPAAADEFAVRQRERIVVPDATLLFQYSALGFNSHKIHIDRTYARNVEGFPDLVVNGGLVTLLMTEFVANDLKALPVSFKTKHLAPLFCDRPIRLTAESVDGKLHVRALDDRGVVAAKMEVEVQ